MNDGFQLILTVAIVGAIILVIWSKIMNQSVLDTVKEIKDIFKEIFNG